MEPVVEIPMLEENDEVVVEDTGLAAPSVFCSNSLENPEDISEDWVSLFLDSSMLDEQSSTLPSHFDSYPLLKCTLEEPNVEFSSQDLRADSLLIDSTYGHLSQLDSVLRSSANLLEESGVEVNLSGKNLSTLDVLHPEEKHGDENIGPDGSLLSNSLPTATAIFSLSCPVSTAAPTFESTFSRAAYGTHDVASAPPTCVQVYSSASPTSSLTQLSGDSSSGLEIDVWKAKEANPEMLVTLKQEAAADEVSSGSAIPTSPTNAVSGGEVGYDQDSPPDSNALHRSSFLLQCEEGGVGAPAVSCETVSGTGFPNRNDNLLGASQSETFGVHRLQSTKVGLLGRVGDRKMKATEIEECAKLHRGEHGGAESLNGQSQESFEDQQSDHSDGDKKGEAGDEDDEKRRARLMRNRESAQLSRQRKKVYVDELESRLRTMAATVAELNATISHLTVENVNLRRQLGYFYQAPSACARPGLPMLGPQVLPLGPYPGMVGGRPIYPGGPVPPIPIPRLKTQPPARSSKRSKSGVVKEDGGDKKRAKKKVAGAAASIAVMSLLCVAMLFSPFELGLNGPDRIGVDNSRPLTHIGHIRVGGRVLTSWNETGDSIHLTGGNIWEPPGPAWSTLHEGEYGPEREGVPSVHTRLAAEKQKNDIVKVRNAGVAHRSSTSNGNTTLASPTEGGTHSRSDCFGAIRDPILLGGGVFHANTSQPFAASVFVPRGNTLVKVDGNLIIQAVMAGDKAAKQNPGKKRRDGVKKVKGAKNSLLAPIEHQVTKAVTSKPLDSTREALVTERAVAETKKSTFSTGNSVTPALRTGSLQQWLLGGLHGPVLNTGMCTELFQFDTTPATTSPEQNSKSDAKDVAEAVASSAAQGGSHNVTSKLSAPLLPRSRRDPFAVPLPPVRPKIPARAEKGKNGTDPRVEKIVREQVQHSENLRDGASSMVVSVLAGPEEYGDNRRKGTKGMSRIFVVVLVNGEKYVTYSCILPSGARQSHVVAD